MCFHISSTASTQAKNNNNTPQFKDYYHVSGFAHPKLGIEMNKEITSSNWGLIPHWIKNESDALYIRSKTLNARIETIHEKPSFRDAQLNRGILHVDGFFEFKYENNKNLPHYIYQDYPIGLGIIISEWNNTKTGEVLSTFSIVTKKASNILKKIHNNPKLKEPRSPLFIDLNNQEKWLYDNDHNHLENVSGEIERTLKFHEVNKLSGKSYVGNNPNVLEPVKSQLGLF